MGSSRVPTQHSQRLDARICRVEVVWCMPTLARCVQWLHVEDIDALHLSQNFQSLETSGLVEIGGDGTGLTTGRLKVAIALDICAVRPSALLPHILTFPAKSHTHRREAAGGWASRRFWGRWRSLCMLLVVCWDGLRGAARGSHWERTSARGERKGAGGGGADDGTLGKRGGGAAEEHGGGGGGCNAAVQDCESEELGDVVGLIRELPPPVRAR